jgi:hydrogenase expression/formation protein HypE
MDEKITMDHGGGGLKSEELIRGIILPYFDSFELNKMNDSAFVRTPTNDMVFTTDSFVVEPLFFPGGDIGKMAVYGTVNDLSVMKAKPKVLSLAFIIEEGFLIKDLRKILVSIKSAAADSDIKIVTGDTKVVESGRVGGIFINTSGIGEPIAPHNRKMRIGDAVIVSNSIAEHGMAIVAKRKKLKLRNEIKSDCRSLFPIVREILREAPETSFMRDAARGGLATTLNEIANKSNLGVVIYENKIPIKDSINEVCSNLCIDPLTVANEGVLVAVVPSHKAEKIVSRLKMLEASKNAEIVGHITDDFKKAAVMEMTLGGKKIIDKPKGEILPRIC